MIIGRVTYRYEDLGDEEFQELVSALVAWDGSRRARAMPLGQADGGRDAVDGPAVAQVKYTKDVRRPNPIKWLLTALDDEESSIRGLVSRGTRHYVLATNVAGTGALDVGTIDRLDAELRTREAAWGLETLVVWWRNDIDTRFGFAPMSMKLRFRRALTSDELLAVTLVDRSQAADPVDRTLAAYIADRFNQDNRVRFEQADLNGPTVEKLFVDVPVTCPAAGSPAAELLDRLGSPGDGDPSGPPGWSAGAARLLLHPDWTGNAVIVGGPGQGKTTLLQSICQFERARHLRDADYVKQLKPNGPVSDAARVPIRIDLRRYAAWSRAAAEDGSMRADDGRDGEDAGQSLEMYLADHVREHSGGLAFTVADLASVVAERPVLLALDGLDEVASLTERDRVAAQISRSAVRLHRSALDLVILVATRPGATSVTSLLAERFPTLNLQRLTEALRLRYLDKWAAQAGLDRETTARLRSTFVDNYQVPHVRELASNPMQLAILLHLLQKRGILPEQRTQLYDDYIKVFLDREAPKEPVVQHHRLLIEEVHGFLAWRLQSSAEAEGGSGSVPLDELRSLLRDFLHDRGRKEQEIADLFTAVTSRVICLVHREAGFEFEVQPLREYFAARHIFDNAPPGGDGNSRDDCLNALLRRPYWSNVLRFFAGRLSRIEVRAVPSNLRTVLAEEPFDRLPLCRATAGQLLNDQVFLGHKSVPIRDAVDAALNDQGAVLADDGFLDVSGGRFVVGEDAARAQVAAHCKERLAAERAPEIRAALARLLVAHDDRKALQRWWWDSGQRSPSRAWLTTAADLDVLGTLNNKQAAHVLACSEDRDGEPVVRALLRAGSATDDGRLLRHCASELGNGHAHGDKPLADANTAVERLCKWSHPSWFGTGPGTGGSGSGPGRRRRIRVRGGSAPSDTAGRLQAIYEVPGERRAADWLGTLDVLRDGFGDCWLLREAAFAMPAGLRPATAVPPLIAAGASRDELLAWVAAASDNRKDLSWWQAQRPDAGDDALALRTWALAAAAVANAAVVADSFDFFNEALAALSPVDTASLLLTARRRTAASGARSLDLREPVRLRQVTPTAVLALLLHSASFEATQEQLAPYIRDGLAALLALGPAVGALALPVAAEAGGKIQIGVFRGARSIVPPGTLLGPSGPSRPALGTARDILAKPHLWPSDVLQLATDQLVERLAAQAPLADVANADAWFAD